MRNCLGNVMLMQRQKQTRQEHPSQEGGWGSGEKARKHRKQVIIDSDKQTERNFG